MFNFKCQYQICLILYLSTLNAQSMFEQYLELSKKKEGLSTELQQFGDKPISLSFGRYDIQRVVSNYIDISYTFDSCSYRDLFPSIGFLATDNTACYVYGSLHLFWPFGVSRFALKPAFNSGYYFKGGGVDLGSNLEFRSSISLLFRGRVFDCGLNIAHISNAHTGSINPGLEMFGLFCNFWFT